MAAFHFLRVPGQGLLPLSSTVSYGTEESVNSLEQAVQNGNAKSIPGKPRTAPVPARGGAGR
jgi:hypothetical protein